MGNLQHHRHTDVPVMSASILTATNPLQQNLCTEDTIGTQLAILYREVSLIQRQILRSSMWLG